MRERDGQGGALPASQGFERVPAAPPEKGGGAMCGTETGKRVKDKTVTGPTMGLTCNKGEPKVRPSLSFYRCTAYFAAGMEGPIIIHICKKEGFPLLSALITPIGFIVFKQYPDLPVIHILLDSVSH